MGRMDTCRGPGPHAGLALGPQWAKPPSGPCSRPACRRIQRSFILEALHLLGPAGTPSRQSSQLVPASLLLLAGRSAPSAASPCAGPRKAEPLS
jgi:hypothetical protein